MKRCSFRLRLSGCSQWGRPATTLRTRSLVRGQACHLGDSVPGLCVFQLRPHPSWSRDKVPTGPDIPDMCKQAGLSAEPSEGQSSPGQSPIVQTLAPFLQLQKPISSVSQTLGVVSHGLALQRLKYPVRVCLLPSQQGRP